MNTKKILLASGIVIVLGIATIFGFTIYGIRLNNLPTGSMANTILPGESFITTKFFGKVQRGDIIAFQLPSDPKVVYVKRVIGMPEEEILVKGTSVFINGKEIPEQKVFGEIEVPDNAPFKVTKEDPAPAGAKYKVFYDLNTVESHLSHGMKFGVEKPYKIPNDSFFMMGDSRDNSLDSRYWGVVPKANVVSKVLKIYKSSYPDRVYTNLEIND